ncbi:MAG: cyclic nucleotide-binding domain-containing protein, partial [Okeania sp. SIO2H7]|nr:cyclic nucleotide-binding domain-containing protein [Okeania sp. SIO2H7]
LLVWIDDPPDSEPITSSLNFLVEYELRHRDIVIPFPQRDLWIKNPEDLHLLVPNNNSLEPTNGKVLQQSNLSSKNKKNGSQKPKKSVPKSPNNWNLRDLLRRVTYFENFTDLELRQLIEYGYRQLFPERQVIFEENDSGDSFYVILSGAVEVISQKTGQYIATLHEGEFFGEMSLLLGSPRTATVRTMQDSVLFIIEQHDLKKLLEEQPDLAVQISHKLYERQQALKDLGLLEEASTDNTPFYRIRSRIQTLFGI